MCYVFCFDSLVVDYLFHDMIHHLRERKICLYHHLYKIFFISVFIIIFFFLETFIFYVFWFDSLVVDYLFHDMIPYLRKKGLYFHLCKTVSVFIFFLETFIFDILYHLVRFARCGELFHDVIY